MYESLPKIIADTAYILPRKWLTFGADLVQDVRLSVILVSVTH